MKVYVLMYIGEGGGGFIWGIYDSLKYAEEQKEMMLSESTIVSSQRAFYEPRLMIKEEDLKVEPK